MLEWFSDASAMEKVANAFLLICTGLGIVFGVRTGKQAAKPRANEQVEVAGALIDSTQARAIVAALDANTAAVRQASIVGREVSDDIKDVGRDLREVIRKVKE